MYGDVAQLARAFDWQSKGRRFESDLLHNSVKCPFFGAFFFADEMQYSHNTLTIFWFLAILMMWTVMDNVSIFK